MLLRVVVGEFPRGRVVPLAMVMVGDVPLLSIVLLITTDANVTPLASMVVSAVSVPPSVNATLAGNVPPLVIVKLPETLIAGLDAVVKVAEDPLL